MTGRVSVFADDEMIRLLSERFVAVTGDNWYRRRRLDDEGDFFMGLVKQGPPNRPGRRTHQGIYFFTADGKLLALRNHSSPEIMLREAKQALRKWELLPESVRSPGAIEVKPWGKPDPKFHRSMPEGTLVINTFMRPLDEEDGKLCRGRSNHRGGHLGGRDHLWLLPNEWKSLVPRDVDEGDTIAVPRSVRERILRFHFADHTRGQAYAWRARDIHESEMKLVAVRADDQTLQLRMSGSALLMNAAEEAESRKGYECNFSGYITWDRKRNRFTRFDLVAVGEHWGDDRYNRGAMPGRTKLGVAFELCADDDPSREVPPQGITGVRDYFGTIPHMPVKAPDTRGTKKSG